MLQQARTIYLA